MLNYFVHSRYCNRRVLKFSAQGTLIETWDGPVSSLPLFIPHKASLSRDQSTLYIADRENQRVLSYDTSTGAAMVFSGPLESAVYAVCVNGSGGWPMYGVYGGKPGSMGFSLDSHGEVMNTWGPSNVSGYMYLTACVLWIYYSTVVCFAAMCVQVLYCTIDADKYTLP